MIHLIIWFEEILRTAPIFFKAKQLGEVIFPGFTTWILQDMSCAILGRRDLGITKAAHYVSVVDIDCDHGLGPAGHLSIQTQTKTAWNSIEFHWFPLNHQIRSQSIPWKSPMKSPLILWLPQPLTNRRGAVSVRRASLESSPRTSSTRSWSCVAQTCRTFFSQANWSWADSNFHGDITK